MKEKVLEAIEKFSLLENVKKVTVAVSGGADSIALLHIMRTLKDYLGIEVSAAHFNHLIRGAEAYRDEEFVRSFCDNLGVQLIVKREDVPSFAKRKKLSTELAARKLRYEFFEEISCGAAVATAHTASDNLETVILNLARGSASDGLCGIPPKRDNFIRPLILCKRQDIEDYCKHNSLDFVTDSTNLSDNYTRNKIRHFIVPVLKEINPAVELSVIKTANSLREDNAVLRDRANEFILNNSEKGFISTEGISDLPAAVAKRALRIYVSSFLKTGSLENYHIEKLYEIAKKGGNLSLPENLQASVSNWRLFVVPADKKEIENPFSVEITNKSECFKEFDEKIHNLLLKNSLDCDKIIGQWQLRTRLPGDSIRIANKGQTKTLKKLYNEYKIPLHQRNFLPVIADDKGVIWIHGIGVAERCAVNKNTKRMLNITVKER